MADKGVLGGSVPCQSQSQTVPKDPSPTNLSGVYDRVEPGERGDIEPRAKYTPQIVRGEETSAEVILTASGVTNDEFPILHGDRGDGLNRDAFLRGRRLGARIGGRRMGLLGRRGIVVCGVGVAVWHLRRVGVEEVDWWIMALVDMVCVHDMNVACIAHGWKGLEAQRVSWAHEGGNKDRAEVAGRDDGGAGGRGKRKRGRRREGDGRERASTERPHPLSRGRRETESTSRSQPFIFHLFSPILARPRAPPAFPFGDYPTDAAPAAESLPASTALSLPPSTLPAATARRPATQAQAVHSARDSPPVTTIEQVYTVCSVIIALAHRPQQCMHPPSSMPPSKLLIMISIAPSRQASSGLMHM